MVSGTATAVVWRPAEDVLRRHGRAIASAPRATEFEHGLKDFSLLLSRTVVFLVIFLVVISCSASDPFQSLLFAVALAVGLTPEFLPMISP